MKGKKQSKGNDLSCFSHFCTWKTKNYYLNISPFSPCIVFLSGPVGYKSILMIISKFKLLTDGIEITDLTQKCQGIPSLVMRGPTAEATLRSAVALPWLCRGQKPAGLTSPPSAFPDTSEHRRLRREERDGWREEEEERLLSPFHLYSPLTPVDLSPLCPSRPPVPPSFLAPPCLFAGTPALRLFSLSLPPSLSLYLSLPPSHFLQSCEEVKR